VKKEVLDDISDSGTKFTPINTPSTPVRTKSSSVNNAVVNSEDVATPSKGKGKTPASGKKRATPTSKSANENDIHAEGEDGSPTKRRKVSNAHTVL
jgi:hypothetical protein